MEEYWDIFLEEQQNRELEWVLLVGVDTGEEQNFDNSMEELKQLAKACFMEPVGTVTQRMEFVHKALYIGTGKVQEVRDAAQALDAQLILINDTLTPSQIKNLQNELKTPVIDRTTLILNIFEMRARTREARLQVETAKLQYLLTAVTLSTVSVNCVKNWMPFPENVKHRESAGDNPEFLW